LSFCCIKQRGKFIATLLPVLQPWLAKKPKR
jgi:hypothetical protein